MCFKPLRLSFYRPVELGSVSYKNGRTFLNSSDSDDSKDERDAKQRNKVSTSSSSESAQSNLHKIRSDECVSSGSNHSKKARVLVKKRVVTASESYSDVCGYERDAKESNKVNTNSSFESAQSNLHETQSEKCSSSGSDRMKTAKNRVVAASASSDTSDSDLELKQNGAYCRIERRK